MTGTVIGRDGTALTFSSPLAGTIKVALDQVKGIQSRVLPGQTPAAGAARPRRLGYGAGLNHLRPSPCMVVPKPLARAIIDLQAAMASLALNAEKLRRQCQRPAL